MSPTPVTGLVSKTVSATNIHRNLLYIFNSMYVCHESKPHTKVIPNICVLSCAKLFLEDSYLIAFHL